MKAIPLAGNGFPFCVNHFPDFVNLPAPDIVLLSLNCKI